MLLHRIQDFQEALAGDGVEAPDAGPGQNLDRSVSGSQRGASSHRILLLLEKLATELPYHRSVTGTSLPRKRPNKLHADKDYDFPRCSEAPVILTVDAAAIHAAGHAFYQAANGVWLTDHVPPGDLSGWPG
jgi:hypothetical protein